MLKIDASPISLAILLGKSIVMLWIHVGDVTAHWVQAHIRQQYKNPLLWDNGRLIYNFPPDFHFYDE